MKKIFYFVCFLLFFSFSAKAETDVVSEVFETLAQDYIVEKTPKEIALKGLKAITDIDKDILIKHTTDKIFLYQKDKVLAKFDMPQNEYDKNSWIEFCKDVLQKSTKLSSKLDVLDFELPDRFANAVFKDLDGYSNYFSVFSTEGDEPIRIRRQFASRVIDDILLIRVLSFQRGVSQKIKTAVEECSICKGIILDLRGNHGGFFDEAVKIADLFLDEGIVAYTTSPLTDESQYFTAETGDIAFSKPMVVLIDGMTASAAEILAASLSEQNRAVLVGTKTYGKGTVQDVKKIGGERAMSVTTSFFYTPSGLKIDKIGVTPMICVTTGENCDKEDRLNKEEDIERAVMLIKTGI